MRKKVFAILLFILSGLLTAGYAARLYYDYVHYYEYGSSPFWLYMITRSPAFMLPAIACLIGGIVLFNKTKK